MPMSWTLNIPVLIALVLTCSSCKPRTLIKEQQSELAARGIPVGEFRGVKNINRVLTQSIFSREALAIPTDAKGTDSRRDYFSVFRYFDAKTSTLDSMLGLFTEGKYSGGAPNALNMYVWQGIASKIALDVANQCAGIPPQFPLRTEFYDRVKILCRERVHPKYPQKFTRFYHYLWEVLIGYEWEGEKIRVRNLLQNSWNDTDSADARVYTMVYLILIHPAFLLEP